MSDTWGIPRDRLQVEIRKRLTVRPNAQPGQFTVELHGLDAKDASLLLNGAIRFLVGTRHSVRNTIDPDVAATLTQDELDEIMGEGDPGETQEMRISVLQWAEK